MLSRIRIALLAVAALVGPRSAALAGDVTVGSFAKSTAAAPVSQTVAHGLGETPKALILWTVGNTNESFAASFRHGFGFTDGTTSKAVAAASERSVQHANNSRRIANKAITLVEWDEVLLAEADLLSWDATNFTLGWTTNNAVAAVVHFIAVGGSGVSAKVVGWTMPTSSGTKAVTGVGFQPDVVIHAHVGHAFTSAPPANLSDGALGIGVMDSTGAQWATTYHSDDPFTKADTQRYQRTDQCVVSIDPNQVVRKEAGFTSMDADGFTMTFTTANANASQAVSLALKGVWVKTGSFAKATGAAPATQAITGLAFRPDAVLLASVQNVASASVQDHTRFGFGASDGSIEGSIAFHDLDKPQVADVDSIDKTSKVFVKVDNATPAIDAEADLTSLDANGFTLGWTTNDAVATEILYLALRPRRRVLIQ